MQTGSRTYGSYGTTSSSQSTLVDIAEGRGGGRMRPKIGGDDKRSEGIGRNSPSAPDQLMMRIKMYQQDHTATVRHSIEQEDRYGPDGDGTGDDRNKVLSL